MNTQHELAQRWDSFLRNIESRFNESCKHAEEACLEELKETNYDYYTAFRAWHGMKSQIYDLIQKIDETWEQKVEPQMLQVSDVIVNERTKGGDLNHKLVVQLDSFQKMLEYKMSIAFYNHAIQSVKEKHACTQCNSPLDIKDNLFRTHYVDCKYCNATNTFEPDSKYAMIRWNIVDNIAWYNAKKEFDHKEKTLNEILDQRPPVEEIYWDKYKHAFFDYYKKYFSERIKLDAEAEERYEQDMKKVTLEYNKYEKNYKRIK